VRPVAAAYMTLGIKVFLYNARCFYIVVSDVVQQYTRMHYNLFVVRCTYSAYTVTLPSHLRLDLSSGFCPQEYPPKP
jgi:hypothetical protein